MEMATHLLSLTLLIGGSLTLAAFGEFLSEQTGVLNLGIEGLMSIGAITGMMLSLSNSTASFALLGCIIAGLICGIIFATATIVFKADQALCGLALTMSGIGTANFIGKPIEGILSPTSFHTIPLPFLSTLPVIGPTLFSQNLISYGIYFLLPPAIHLFLFKTRYGLHARAVGENPDAAHALGIPVNRIRYIYSCLGSIMATLAGGYLILSTTNSWSEGFISGQGWIAIALVLLGRYHIPYIIIAGLCFGFISSLSSEIHRFYWSISSISLNIILYSFIILFSVIPRLIPALHKKSNKPPSGLAIPFFHPNH